MVSGDLMETEKLGIAVVTGSSTGIGFASALELARRGYRVFAGMRNTAKAEPLTKIAEQEDLGITVVAMDVTSAASCDAAFTAVRQSGPIDVLVNNAGITKDNIIVRMKEEDWDSVLNTNLKGCFNGIKAVTRPMIRKKNGRIINITSVIPD